MKNDTASSKKRRVVVKPLRGVIGVEPFAFVSAHQRLRRNVPHLVIQPSSAIELQPVSETEGQVIAREQPSAPSGASWFLLFMLGLGVAITLLLPSISAAAVLFLVVIAGVLAVIKDSTFGLRPAADRKHRLLNEANLRGVLQGGFALIALLALVGSAYFFIPSNDTKNRIFAVLLLLIGFAVLTLTLRIRGENVPSERPAAAFSPPARAHAGMVFNGVILLAWVTAINAQLFKLDFLIKTSTHAQFLLWVLGIVLVAWGLCGLPGFRLPHIGRTEILILIAITVLAFAVRIYQSDTAVHTSIDEVHFMDGVRFLREKANFPLLAYSSGYLPITMVPLYFNYVAIELTGQSTLGTLRLAEAVIGTLSVLAVYGLCRALFNRNLAAVAAIILLGLPLHIHFSRIAMAHVADPLFGTLAFMFIVRGLKTNRRADWVLGGVSLGLTQYFFEGGRLLFPLLVIIWTVVLWFAQQNRIRHYGRSYLVFGIAAIFVAAPVYFTAYALNSSRASRYQDSGINAQYISQMFADGFGQNDVDELARRVTDPFLMYVNRAEGGVLYFGGDQPIVPILYVPFFLLGASLLLLNWRRTSFGIFLWIVATGVGNSLLHDPNQAPRYIAVLPALAICTAVGMGNFLPLLSERLRSSKRWVPALTIGISVVMSTIMIGYYFGPHLQRFNTQFREAKWYGDATDAVLRVAGTYPDGTHIIVISDPEVDINVPRAVLNFVAHQQYLFQVMPTSNADADFFAELPRDVNYAFFIDPADSRTYERIREYFSIEPPQYSRNVAMPASREFILVYAPIAP